MKIVLFLFLVIANACLYTIAVSDDNLRASTIEQNTNACKKWYSGEPNATVFLRETRDCPCRIPTHFAEKLSDGAHTWLTDSGCVASKQPNTCSYHKGAHGCYRHGYKSKGPGAQCCYDREGNWIKDEFAGGGTLDRERAPDNILNLIQWNAHNKHDVIPWNNCCKEPGMPTAVCILYYEKRPSGNCKVYPDIF